MYNGEDNVQQNNVTVLDLPGLTGTTPQTAATAAFDETIDSGIVLVYIAPFIL